HAARRAVGEPIQERGVPGVAGPVVQDVDGELPPLSPVERPPERRTPRLRPHSPSGRSRPSVAAPVFVTTRRAAAIVMGGDTPHSPGSGSENTSSIDAPNSPLAALMNHVYGG